MMEPQGRCMHMPWCLTLGVLFSLGMAGCGPAGVADTGTGNQATADDASPIAYAKVELASEEEGERAPAAAAGEDWPEFLGTRQSGISGETGLLKKWPEEGPKVLWKLKLGEGYAAPSVRGNRLVVFHRPLQGRSSGDKEVVECLAADTGKRLWIKDTPSNYEDPYGYNGGPRCAPLLTADRCYTFGAEGRLVCWNLADGEKIWERHTGQEFQVPPAFFGVGAAPILEGQRLIVMVGGHPNAGVVAFDPATGKTLWQNVGPEAFPPPPVRIQRDRPPAKLASYATPLAATIHGKRHVLCFMRPGLVSLDPETGEVNFSYWFRSPLHDSVNAARPVVVDDKIFLSAAYETGAAVLKVRADGKSYDVVWSDVDAMQTHWSTAIHDRGFVYGFSGRHEVGSSFRCIELLTGKLKWQTNEPFSDDVPDPKDGRGRTQPKYYGRGSAVLADGKFIVLGERGVLALVDADAEKFHEISRVQFPEAGYPSWAAPVLSRKRLYLSVAREMQDAFGRYAHEYHLLCLDLADRGERAGR
ncbi:MAG: PQQ-like beta-propeller repeat protein [Planctomycetes bacterium]|nr:PQQ-like beta-propeller repeat protein [Planctomycetota bacterium]